MQTTALPAQYAYQVTRLPCKLEKMQCMINITTQDVCLICKIYKIQPASRTIQMETFIQSIQAISIYFSLYVDFSKVD